MSSEEAERQITRGALTAIFNDPEVAKTQFPVPVLQCLQIKALGVTAGGTGNDRYRVVLSDMSNYVQTMLATQVNHVIHEGKLVRGSIVRVKASQANSVKGKNILIILDLDVIESLGAHEKLGDPTPVDTNGAAATAAAPATSNIGGTNFYGAKKEEPDSKQGIKTSTSSYGGGGGGGGGGGAGGAGMQSNIYPIEGLSPYSHKWMIKARVTSKSEIRTWHKSSGEGKLFSVNLLDESSEIKATAFNDVCDQFYDLLQEGNVYYISSPCRVSIAKKQFSNLPNDYELMLERDTRIEKAEDQASVPQVRYAFCNIQALQSVEKDAVIDVIGVLKDVSEVSSITSKSSGKPYEKRELTLVDDSGFSVRTTIWGKTAVHFDAKPESVVALKGVRVSDFGGRSLSLLQSGVMSIDPDITEAHKLKGWYDAAGRSENFSSHNSMGAGGAGGGLGGRTDEAKTIGQVRDENLGMEDVAYFTLKGTIVFIKQETFAYPACSSDNCSKKVVENGDGTWRCEKCDVNHPRARYRYTMMLNVNDHSGQLWLTCFDDVGRLVMGGRSADEMMELREEDDAAFAAAFDKANCRKFAFRVRAKLDTFGDAQRIRYQIMNASPLDFKSEGHKLAELIKQFSI